jgi:hypothetical protein
MKGFTFLSYQKLFSEKEKLITVNFLVVLGFKHNEILILQPEDELLDLTP